MVPAPKTTRGAAPARAPARLSSTARRKSGAPKLFVEVASLDSDLVEADLDVLFGPGPDGVFLPCCDGAAGLQRLAVKLAVREAQAGLADGATRIAAFVGSDAGGVLALRSFAGASPRLAALAFDEAGLRAALRLADGGGAAIETARAMVVLAAASAGVPGLAPPIETGAEAAYAAARRDGFTGAMARYPGQVAAHPRHLPGGRESTKTEFAGIDRPMSKVRSERAWRGRRGGALERGGCFAAGASAAAGAPSSAVRRMALQNLPDRRSQPRGCRRCG